VARPDYQRCLVIRGGALGDFLLTLPVLAALREASPGARLEVLAYPSIAELARGGGLIDAARSIEYGPLAGFFTRGAVLDPALRDYFASFDLVLSYLYDPDGIFAENLRGCGVTRLVIGPHRPSGSTHAIDALAAPLTSLGVPLANRAVPLAASSSTRRGEIFLHPGSGSPAKNWPGENWRTLAASLLAEDPEIRFALVAGEADAAALAPLRDLVSSHRVRLLENLPLPALAGELAGGLAYFGHDTGVSHLAAVSGCPALLLFGPTDPGVWAPPHNHVRILRAPGGRWDALTVDTVASAAKRLVALARAAGRGQNPSS